MVRVIENRTDLEGVILDRAEHPRLPEFDLLQVDVRRASPVEGVADLLSSRVGSKLELAVKRSILPGQSIGGLWIRCRAYLGGPGEVFVEPRPSPGTCEIGPMP